MGNLHPISDKCSAENERSISRFKRSIRLSQGQFSLIFFHCNFRSLREEIAQKLQEDATLELTELNLPYSCPTLYGAIADFINPHHPPKALIISGLELVKDLKRVLTSANKARDQFRQDFSFPIVLWVTDKILYHLGRIANDLNTWAGASICFDLSPEQLIILLRQEAHKAFSNNLNFTGKNLDELEYIYQELKKLEPQLTPEEKAIFVFLYGLVNYQKNKLDAAIDNYRTSLEFWQENNRAFEAGIVCVKIAQIYDKKAEEKRAQNQEFWQEAKKNLQQSLAYFESINNQDLVASAISQLGGFLRRLQAWDDLEKLAKKGLEIQFNNSNGTTLQLAQNYGFLAEVALQNEAWEKVEELAKLALAILKIFEAPEKEDSLYLLLLAQAQGNLNQVEKAILNLETAKKITEPQDNVELYLSILAELKKLYFAEKEYLKAFNIKLEQQKIKSKFRLQAFIGVGRLQPPEQFLHQGLDVWEKTDEILEDIVTASGRSQDVKNLLERVTRPDCKLTIIYGQSGVGKSSLVQAGLVPALKLISIESRDVIPVLVQSYHDWLQDSSIALIQVIQEVTGVNLAVNIQTENHLIEQFKKNEQRNLYTVLIFDQFEEFFFLNKNLGNYDHFYNFLSVILQIPYLKVILSLREDYLHYLLDCNRKINLSAIDNDILNKKNLYYIGNFSKFDAKNLIQTLTERSQIDLEPALVDQLIEDLGGIVEEVRPIELQIVGTQLEFKKIWSLKDYQELGNNAKEKLVESFLQEVISDCGEENKEIAELILYLLTDENNTRPLKTKEELIENLADNLSQFNLIFEILVQARLILEIPSLPIVRYQLVHDYLVSFIRKQQSSELLKKLQNAEIEKKRLFSEHQKVLAETEKKLEQISIDSKKKANLLMRTATGIFLITILLSATVIKIAWDQVNQAQKIIKLDRLVNDISGNFELGGQIDTLISAVEAGRNIKQLFPHVDFTSDYPISTPVFTLQQILNNLREKNRLKGHIDSIYSIRFSPNGKYIATASKDQTVRLWNLQGKLLQKLQLNHSIIYIRFSPKSNIVGTVSNDGIARLWNLKGKLLKQFKYNNSLVLSINFSPDEKLIATASNDGNLRIFNNQGKLIQKWKAHQKRINDVSFSSDSKLIATASDDFTVRLWNIQGKLIKEFTGKDKSISLDFSPNGKYLAFSFSSDYSIVEFWNIFTQTITSFSTSHRVTELNFSPDSELIATSSFYDGTARLWNLQGELLQEFSHNNFSINGINFSPDGKYLATASDDKIARLWSVENLFLKHDSSVLNVSFSPDGKYFATVSRHGMVYLWTLQGKLMRKFQGHKQAIWGISFSPDGRYLATASDDKTVKLWDLEGKLLKEFYSHESAINSITFSPDSQFLATVSEDKTLKLWDLQGKILKIIRHPSVVISVSFSPDGHSIITGSVDGIARLWNLKGELLQNFRSHKDRIQGVSFSPNSKLIATASDDGTARLWNLQGELLKEFKDHPGRLFSVSFSPDGKSIATSSNNKTVRLWDLQGKLIEEFKGHKGKIFSVKFSPNGKYIVTASDDKTARVWRVESLDQMLVRACDWLQDYLEYNAEQNEKYICDFINHKK